MWPYSRAAITSVHLVENSPMMRSRQGLKLAAWRELQDIPSYWWDSIEDIPRASGKLGHGFMAFHQGFYPLYSEDEFTMVIAHEFFDALPVNIIEEKIVTRCGPSQFLPLYL